MNSEQENNAVRDTLIATGIVFAAIASGAAMIAVAVHMLLTI